MSLFGKKNAKGIKHFQEVGKTEAISMETENIPIPSPGRNFDPVPPTSAVAGGGLVTVDPFTDQGGSSPTFAQYGPTVSASTLTNASGEKVKPIVGWLVCTEGIYKGKAFDIFSGHNFVGREQGDIVIAGDPEISAKMHMAVSYDPKSKTFRVSPRDAHNYIYLNGEPVDNAAILNDYDIIKTGGTSLCFIGFCGKEFTWEDEHA